jgi:nascent polypeptide-associated complex subunit alpha
MLDRMGLDMKELNNVQEVIIKTDKKKSSSPSPQSQK